MSCRCCRRFAACRARGHLICGLTPAAKCWRHYVAGKAAALFHLSAEHGRAMGRRDRRVSFERGNVGQETTGGGDATAGAPLVPRCAAPRTVRIDSGEGSVCAEGVRAFREQARGAVRWFLLRCARFGRGRWTRWGLAGWKRCPETLKGLEDGRPIRCRVVHSRQRGPDFASGAGAFGLERFRYMRPSSCFSCPCCRIAPGAAPPPCNRGCGATRHL